MDSFEEDDQVEESSPQSDEVPTKQLEHALSDLGRGGRWLRTLFLLGSVPGLLNAMHLVVYVFYAQEPSHFCKMDPQFSGRNVSEIMESAHFGNFTQSSCSYTDWSRNELSNLTFDEHQAAAPIDLPCTTHVFLDSEARSSIVSEWNLVCEDSNWRPMTQVALGIGKIIGSLVFGCISDRMGRKTSFLAASFIYLVAGPAAAFVYYFPAFVFLRVALAAAGSGAYNAAYMIMAESAQARKRPNLGVLFNLSYPIGFLATPVLALAFEGWRPLQLAISLPALLLVLPCWHLPESPRWLISQGRQREALYVVRHATTKNVERQRSISTTDNRPQQQEEEATCWTGTRTFLSRLAGMLQDAMFRKRLVLSQLIWFACALTYHTLMLSGPALKQQPHRYVVLLASVEILAYLLPLPMLKRWSRRICLTLLLVGSTSALLILLIIPQQYTGGILAAAMASRFFISSAYSVITLFTSELFPTVTRNTALGTCSTFAQIGSISAPFLVEAGGVGFSSIATWICLITSSAAIFLALGLPALKNIHLVDTLAQARCSEAELKEISFYFSRKGSNDESVNELSDIPEEEASLDLSHLGLG